jgi:hypothetical protein
MKQRIHTVSENVRAYIQREVIRLGDNDDDSIESTPKFVRVLKSIDYTSTPVGVRDIYGVDSRTGYLIVDISKSYLNARRRLVF